jgi:glycosyltransferase involved in cell wall biosynthesis
MSNVRFGIITFPISKAGITPLSNLVDIFSAISEDVIVVTGNDGFDYFKESDSINTYGFYHQGGKNVFSRIGQYIHMQIKISFLLLKLRKKTDYWVFFIGGENLLFPFLIAKVTNKKIISLMAGYTTFFETSFLNNILVLVSYYTRMLSDKIVLYSSRLIDVWDMSTFKKKIVIASKHFIDFNIFKNKKLFNNREKKIGFIGRFGTEKGVYNFVKSISIIINNDEDAYFFIIGDGEEGKHIKEYIKENNLENKVNLKNWVDHQKLPNYLNDLGLLVIPSLTEGLPNIMLEAMACGTPVLATPVGAIPDLIKDGETGFIMENNSPECIAKNIIRALNHPDLEEISNNARKLVEHEFTFEKAVERFRIIIDEN